MKVFDREVKRCGDCQYSFPKSEKNTSEYLYCGELEEYIPENGFVVLDNCPFKYKNSFTEEQFNSIGFEKEDDVRYRKELINGVILIKLTKLGFTYYTEYIYEIQGEEVREIKEVEYKATSFPHLKFILDSLI